MRRAGPERVLAFAPMNAGRIASETDVAPTPQARSSRPVPGRAAEFALRARGLTERSFRRIVVLLVALVVVPTFLLLGLGVVLLFLGELNANLLMGILVLALSGAAATGVILVWVFVTREANLSQLQTDFVSKVSHELRTPLTSIRLFSETLAPRKRNASRVSRGRALAFRRSSIGCSTGVGWRAGGASTRCTRPT